MQFTQRQDDDDAVRSAGERIAFPAACVVVNDVKQKIRKAGLRQE